MVEELDKSKWKNKNIGWSIVQVFKVRHIHNKIVSDTVLPSYLSFVFVQGQGASKWHIFDTQLEGIKSWLHPMADPHLAFVKSLLRYLISSFCLCSLLIIVEIQDWTADEIYFRYCHISWYFLQPGKYQLWCRWYRLNFCFGDFPSFWQIATLVQLTRIEMRLWRLHEKRSTDKGKDRQKWISC